MPKKPTINAPAKPRGAPAAEAGADPKAVAAARAQAELVDALAKLVLAAVDHEAAVGDKRPARSAQPVRRKRRG